MSKNPNNELDAAVAQASQNEVLSDLIKAYVDIRINETKLSFQLLDRFLELGKAFVDSEIEHKKYMRKQYRKNEAHRDELKEIKAELEAERSKNKGLRSRLSEASHDVIRPRVKASTVASTEASTAASTEAGANNESGALANDSSINPFIVSVRRKKS